MTNYAYLRVSTDAQDVDNQRHGVSAYCLQRAIAPVEWVEDTASGKTDWRARKLGEIITAAMPGDVLVVAEVSRLARSTLGVLEIIEAARKAGLAVHVVKQNLIADGSTQSHITITVLGLAAQIERELIAARTREALQKRRDAGQKLGRPAGESKNLKLDPHRAAILDMLAKNVSKRSIARMLSVPPSTLHRWLDRNASPDEKTRRAKEKAGQARLKI